MSWEDQLIDADTTALVLRLLELPAMSAAVDAPRGSAPRVQLDCPKGHRLRTVWVERDPYNAHKLHLRCDEDGGAVTEGAAVLPVPALQPEPELRVRTRLRCTAQSRGKGCGYDGRLREARLLKLYARALTLRRDRIRVDS